MKSSLQTRLVHPNGASTDSSGAASTPIYQTATFDVDSSGGYDYSRSGNPTRDVLEKQMSQLEGAKKSLAYNSGIAAVDAVLSLVPHGGRVVVADDLYGGTQRLLDVHEQLRGISVSRFPTGDSGTLESCLQSRADMVLLELPSNPYMRWTNLDIVGDLCRSQSVTLAVDYSMLSPMLLRPFEHGVNIAVQSATKFLGGHSDLTLGIVSTCSAEIADELAYLQNARGTAAGPFESWLLLRGLKTLDVRIERQIANARIVADYLSSRTECRAVYTAKVENNSDRLCPVISVTMESEKLAKHVVQATDVFTSTVSFGGVASSISSPFSMSHACLSNLNAHDPIDARLVRLSIGIERAADLVEDLKMAFDSSSVLTPRNGVLV